MDYFIFVVFLLLALVVVKRIRRRHPSESPQQGFRQRRRREIQEATIAYHDIELDVVQEGTERGPINL